MINNITFKKVVTPKFDGGYIENGILTFAISDEFSSYDVQTDGIKVAISQAFGALASVTIGDDDSYIVYDGDHYDNEHPATLSEYDEDEYFLNGGIAFCQIHSEESDLDIVIAMRTFNKIRMICDKYAHDEILHRDGDVGIMLSLFNECFDTCAKNFKYLNGQRFTLHYDCEDYEVVANRNHDYDSNSRYIIKIDGLEYDDICDCIKSFIEEVLDADFWNGDELPEVSVIPCYRSED